METKQQYFLKVFSFGSVLLLTFVSFFNSWPGLYAYDTVGYAAHALGKIPGGCVQAWESFFFSQILCFFSSSNFVFGYTMILQGVIGISFLLYFLRQTQKCSIQSLFFTTAFYFAFPFFILSFFYLERDVLFALCSATPPLFLLFSHGTKLHFYKKCIIVVGLLAAALLRWEGMLYLSLFPIQLFMLKRISVRKMWLGIFLSVFFFVLNLILSPMQAAQRTKYSLHLSLPVAFRMLDQHPEIVDESVREIFNKVIDLNKIPQVRSVYPGILVRDDLQRTDVLRFHSAVFRLIIKHPILFLQIRWHYLWAGGRRYVDIVPPNYFQKKRIEAFEKTQIKIYENRLVSTDGWLDFKIDSVKKHTVRYFLLFGSFWFGTALTLLAIIISVISPYRKQNLIFSSSSLLQTLIFFIFAPGGNGKYVLLPLYFYSFAFPILLFDLKLSHFLVKQKEKFKKPEFSFRWIKVILNFTIALGAVQLLLGKGWRPFSSLQLNSYLIYGVGLSFVVHLVGTLLQALRWREFLQSKAIPFFSLFRVSWTAQFVGLLSFGGLAGDLQKVLFLNREYKYDLWDAGATCVRERWWSLYTLLTVMAVMLLSYESFMVHSILLLCGSVGFAFSGRVFFLSALAHLLKIFLFLGLASMSLNIDRDVFLASVLMLAEVVPLGLDGLGTSHAVAYTFFFSKGLQAYSAFFLGKVLFKAFGGMFIFKRTLTQNA